MIVIVVNSQKGGVGKSTISAHLAAIMATLGLRVLAIDTDAQAHLTISFDIPKQPGFYNALVRDEPFDSLLRVPVSEIYTPPGVDPKGELYVLPGNHESSYIQSGIEQIELLGDVLEDYAEAFDVAIIDTPPSPGLLMSLIYDAADYLIVPAKLERLSLDGLGHTIKQAQRRNVQLLGIVPYMYKAHTNLHRHHYDQLAAAAQEHGWHLFSPIADRIVWAEASTLRYMVFSLEDSGKARVEIMVLAREVMAALGVKV